MSDSDPMIGRVIRGNIEIRRKIGAGGMGNVYEGYQEHLDRAVAVKVMTPEHAANPVAAKYFLREARSASKLRHPNIIQIIDYGKEDDATLFMAMEYVPGKPLSHLIRKEFPLEPERIVALLDQTLAALTVAHDKQLVHRDLKPDNLMVEEIDGEDFVKVLDFGIAHSKAPEQKAGPLTQQGAVVGTPHYMSPEQAKGDAVDGRSDLFSLGVILYELLTQKPPFDADNMPEVLVSVIRHSPPPPSSERPELSIDPSLESVCLRALKKNPDLRYQTAQEFREALAAVGRDEPSQPREEAPAQFIFKRSRSKSPPPAADQSADAPPGHGDTQISSDSKPSGAGTEISWSKESKPSAVADTEISWSNKTGASGPGLGVDVEQLRGDLLGERADVVTLVAQQRSHRRIDAEEMADLRAVIDEVFNETSQKWGAKIHSRQGSFVTLLFGIPVPRPDDMQRAGHAAVDLRHQLSRFSSRGTEFGFGLAAGEVFCPSEDLSRAAGPPLDDGLEAARAAGDGEIAVTGNGLQLRLEKSFRLGEPHEDGDRPIIDLRDAADVDVEEQGTGKKTELIGRDEEIATILGALGRLSRRKGMTLAFVGEPGVGKTALLEELRALGLQRDFSVLSARHRWNGAEAVRAIRMQWLMDIVRRRGHIRRDARVAFRELGVDDTQARLIGAFLNDELDKVFGKQHTRTADEETRAEDAVRFGMKKVIEAMSEREPIMLLIDGVEGFDGEFADFVRRWTKAARELPILVAPAIRLRAGENAEEFPDEAKRVVVEPLSPAAARAFAKVRLPATAGSDLVDRVVRVAGGFPLHLEHLCRHARARPDLEAEELEAVLAKSRDVGELLRMRLFEQPKPAQNVIALLSALGNGVRGEVVLDLASSGWKPEEMLGRLHEEGLLEVEGEDSPRLYLRPPALRRIAYDRLSRKMRKRIHARAAHYFEERIQETAEHEDMVALAHHSEVSGEPRKALEVLRRLADESLGRYDYELARDYLDDCVRLLEQHAPDSIDARVQLELRLIRCDAAVGRRGEAIDRCRKLTRTEGLSPRTEAEVRLEMARLWLVEEDPSLVEKIARRALQELRSLHAQTPDDVELVGLLIKALQLSARIQEEQDRLVSGAEFALEAVELAERSSIEPTNNPWGPSIVWESLNQLGRLRIRMGESGGARKMFDLARRVVEQAEDPRGQVAVRANTATLLAMEGDLEGAERSLDAALRVARDLGDPSTTARLEFNRGTLFERQQRVDDAREAFEQSKSIAEDIDWREGIAMNVDRLRSLESRSGHPVAFEE